MVNLPQVGPSIDREFGPRSQREPMVEIFRFPSFEHVTANSDIVLFWRKRTIHNSIFELRPDCWRLGKNQAGYSIWFARTKFLSGTMDTVVPRICGQCESQHTASVADFCGG